MKIRTKNIANLFFYFVLLSVFALGLAGSYTTVVAGDESPTLSVSAEEELWYPDVISHNGNDYVPKEDFDYVYNLLRNVETAELEVVELPSIEIVTTRTGQVYARHIPDARTLRVKIGYIDKSIELNENWLEGKVRVINDEGIQPDEPIIWAFGARGAFTGVFDLDNDGLFKPLYDFSLFIESPQLWLFNGFFSFGYRPMEPYLTLGINFRYEYEQ